MPALLDHVWQRGARSPVLLGAGMDFSWKRLLDETYAEWCGAHGIRSHIRHVPHAATGDEIQGIARTVLSGQDPPDAIIAAPDGSA